MLLVVCRAGHARNNPEHRAEAVIHAVNRVGDPASAAPMPPFTFENSVEYGSWAKLRHHRLQRPGMRLFFHGAFAQKTFYILFAGEHAIMLVTKRGFVPLLRGFHASNGNFASEGAVQPAFQSPA